MATRTVTSTFISASKLAAMLSSDTCKNMVMWVLDENRLLLGVDPARPAMVIDLQEEKIGCYNQGPQHRSAETPASTVPNSPPVAPAGLMSPRVTRRSGTYWFEIKGDKMVCGSLRELLRAGLCALEEARPGTLEKLSHIKPRSKYIVAHDRRRLFSNPELVETCTERLMNGWWYGTNNSAEETNRWLERACDMAGLGWGTEFRTSITGEALTLDDL